MNNRFVKFLKSPYLNANTAAIRLCSAIIDVIKTRANLSRSDAFKAIYPDEELNDKKLRKLSSDLIELYQNFLIQEELSSNSLLKYELLLKSIQESKIDILQEKARSNAARYFKREQWRVGDDYCRSI